MNVLGIDIGGTGIKGAPVDPVAGRLLAERRVHPTPVPSTPAAVADVVRSLVAEFDWDGPAGVTMPCPVSAGIVRFVANLDPAWVGVDAAARFAAATQREIVVVNDADAAGLAEMRFGAGAGRNGVVLMLTFGTGIGSALFHDGVLVPNTELGHLEIDGVDAERRAAAVVRERESLSWVAWAARVDRYLALIETILWPDLIIVGGGVSEVAHEWLPLLHTSAPIVPAAFHNEAGIVGAALVAAATLRS